MPRTPPADARARARDLAREPDDAPWSPVRPPVTARGTTDPAEPPLDALRDDGHRLDDGGAGDAADVAARFRSGALGAVASAYTTAHGHPVGADLGEAVGPRRWAVSARAAFLVLAVLVAVGAAVVTVAVSRGAGAPTGRVAAAVDVPTPRASADAGADASGPARSTPTPAPTGADGGTAGGASAGTSILVHVVGAVRHPGLVHLVSGARLEDAVEAAGGPTSSAELDAVNLAGVVTDGEQVRVPRRGEQAGPASGSASGSASGAGSTAAPDASGATSAPVDLNTADAATLDALPGIGPVLAQRIVDRRTQSGPFTSVDQLDEVSGIGPTLLARLREQVRV